MPPMYQRAVSDRPAYAGSSKNSGSPSFHSDWCTCMPEPLSPKIGVGTKVTGLPFAHGDWCPCMPEPLSPKIGWGLKVTDLPSPSAPFLITYLNFMTSSAD